MTKATIVPKKIANRCHACNSTPDGGGRNQTIIPKEIGITKATIRRLASLMWNKRSLIRKNLLFTTIFL